MCGGDEGVSCLVNWCVSDVGLGLVLPVYVLKILGPLPHGCSRFSYFLVSSAQESMVSHFYCLHVLIEIFS